MSTTLATAETELKARGADYLSDTRLDAFLNQAQRELCNLAFWPFTEASSSGASPLTISDLRVIRYVTDDDNDCRLRHLAKHYLIETVGDLTTVGTPTCYYVDSGSIVRTYPVGGTITAAYYKKPAALTSDSDVFIVPDEYMDVVYDLAVRRVLKDAGNYADAATLAADIVAQIDGMRTALLANTDGPADYVRVRMPE